MYIKPTVKYCGEILITANSTNKTKLECVQNEAMRLISGSVKSTPINAMYAHNMPIITELEQQALILYEKNDKITKHRCLGKIPNNTKQSQNSNWTYTKVKGIFKKT